MFIQVWLKRKELKDLGESSRQNKQIKEKNAATNVATKKKKNRTNNEIRNKWESEITQYIKKQIKENTNPTVFPNSARTEGQS